jgi:hypothetical protein
MIGHRFLKIYNDSLYATFLKSNFENKNRGCDVKLYLFKYIQKLLPDYFEGCTTIQIKNLYNADPEDY